ncbi:lipase, partial [Yersinia pestis]
MVRGIANSKIGFGDLILLLRYFFKLKVSTHPRHPSHLLKKKRRT